MRKWAYWGSVILVFAAINGLIAYRHHILANGKTVLLKLAPVDPRALMMGDYMQLRYEFSQGETAEKFSKAPRIGKIVVTLDEHQVAHFSRLHQGESLRQGEVLLTYRNRHGLHFGAEKFFFQEGHAEYYENAKYGELKAASNGQSVLVGLCDKDFRRLGPPAN